MFIYFSPFIQNKIITYIRDTKTILNLRCVSKDVYDSMEIFSLYRHAMKMTFYFKNHQCIKSEYYIYSFLKKEYYLYELTMFNNFKRNGKSYTFYNDKSILKYNFYINGYKHGLEKMYGIDKYLSSTTTYKMGIKSGISYIIDEKYSLIFYYNNNKVVTFSKLVDNKLVYKSLFNNGILQGKTDIYETIFTNNNCYLNFNKNRLEGQSIIIQYDRKLILNFVSGQLDGKQTILNNDNKLEMICNFKNGLIYGPYQLWRNGSVFEYGYCHNIPNLFSNITIIDNNIHYYYPLSYNGLNGNYTEKSIDKQFTLNFNNNVFFGIYTLKKRNTKIEIKIYNENNFVYRKYINHFIVVEYTKKYGEYEFKIFNNRYRVVDV